MNKRIIFAVTIIILVVIIGSAFYIFGIKNIKNEAVNGKGAQNHALILCNDMYSECKANSVVPCEYKGSIIYRVDYNCEDIPAKYFDSNLKLINDDCWGMPKANQIEPPQICNDLDEKCQQDNNMCK